MSQIFVVLAAIAGFLVVFPLFWMGIVYLISRVGGWARLAERYAAQGPATGDAFRMCTARLSHLGNYRNSLNLTVSGSGIHLQPLFIFSTGHDPLFIPWNAVTDLKKRKMLFFTSAQLSVRSDDAGGTTRITFFGEPILESLQRHSPA